MNSRECVEKLIKQGFKAKMIADALNVSAAYISMYRKGKRVLTPKNEKILIKFLEQYKELM